MGPRKNGLSKSDEGIAMETPNQKVIKSMEQIKEEQNYYRKISAAARRKLTALKSLEKKLKQMEERPELFRIISK